MMQRPNGRELQTQSPTAPVMVRAAIARVRVDISIWNSELIDLSGSELFCFL
jgi:hypothetical protein